MRKSRGWFALGILSASASALMFVNCVGDDPAADAPAAPDGGGPTSDGSPGGDDATTPDGGGDGAAPKPLLTDAVTVAAGRSHTCAITASQDVLCWGANGFGQLGVPTAQVARTSVPVRVDVGGKATAIAAGANHTCAILTDGKIKCWGNNERGQLGRNTLVPTGAIDVVSPPASNADLWVNPEVITAGASFTCAGMRVESFQGLPGRRFFCWGENIARQSGTNSSNGQPVLVPSLITQTGNDSPTPPYEGFAIACGDDFACAGVYGAAGAAFFSAVGCWGSRVEGQIGAPPLAGGYEVNPKYPSRLSDGGVSPVFGLFKVGLVAAGAQHGCVRFEQSGVTPVGLDCWGNNTRGQTGAAQSGARPAEPIAGFDATGVTALAAGGQNTCVVDGGHVRCIGANDLGQLGRGTTDADAHPAFADVDLPPSGSALAVGANHACAVLGAAAGQKGPVACWGQNDNGQLGDGLDIDKGYPGAPAALARVRATPVRVLAPE